MSLSVAVRHLRDFVAIPSVNPMGRTDIDARWVGEERYAECVRQVLGRLGVDAVLVGKGQRRSVVGEARAGRDAETLLVASHLDTVPVDNMRIDPFDPVIEEGRLYGRGSCDTKAGMAALLAALERVLARGTLARNLVIVGEADEETGDSIGVTDVLAHLEGSHIDWSIATEPTELRIVNAHKGTALARLEARGRACHSSDPSQGKNAIVGLARAVLALEQLGARLESHVHAGLGHATLSVGLIGGGQAPNIVPDRAWLALDRRTLPGDTRDSITHEIEAALASAGVTDVLVAEVKMGKEPLYLEPGQRAFQACARALERAGCGTTPASVAFGTDAGLLLRAGIPSLVLGPGSIARAHTEAEYVEIDQLERMVSIYEQLLEGT
jgi:acetylornithine deacetylase